MAEEAKFALVRKPSSAVEKAAPGAKRILSGMVGDTLDLARKATSKDVSVADTQLENWYRTGVKYYLGQGVPKDYAQALKWFRKAAEHNHALAQNSVGVCYEKGRGVPQDRVEAVKWYRKAAEQGEAYAQNNLGACYANGMGVSEDYAEAVKWYRKAADQGNTLAKTNLGLLNEKGVPDYSEAVESLRKMAEQGYAPAQYNLGVCYWDGAGVEKNCAEAMKWYRKSAEQGDETAQRRLIIVNYMGSLPEDQRDIVEAYKWARVRAEDESHEWENLENIKNEMTPDQIQRGETLAREFLSKTAR